MTFVLPDAKAYHNVVQMSRNRTEHLVIQKVEAAVEPEGMMTKTEMIEEEAAVAEATAAGEAEAMAAVAVIDKTVEIEEEIVVMVEEEKITTEVVTMVVTLEATEVEAETAVAGVATLEVQVGTKAQAPTTTSDPNPKASIETTAIQTLVEILLIQVINFQLLQPHLILKIELKSTMTLNPKRNHTTLLDHRQTPLFI